MMYQLCIQTNDLEPLVLLEFSNNDKEGYKHFNEEKPVLLRVTNNEYYGFLKTKTKVKDRFTIFVRELK